MILDIEGHSKQHSTNPIVLIFVSESIGYEAERRLSRQSIHIMNGLHSRRSAKGPLTNVSIK